MKKSRFSEEQMVRILRDADRSSIAEAAKNHAVSQQTVYTWRKRFGTLEVADIRRLRELESEIGSGQRSSPIVCACVCRAEGCADSHR